MVKYFWGLESILGGLESSDIFVVVKCAIVHAMPNADNFRGIPKINVPVFCAIDCTGACFVGMPEWQRGMPEWLPVS